MHLTKLELQGFKSFARKTELQLDPGITAVIGPNGSGKSNIADAVRWVLGEQSAKALRGNKMEDVIFNGTQERKAQAYCEVQLTFDNISGALPIDFREVTVGRRVYRSGESEYTINRNNCRLKDIQELFRDTGVGKEGYSIIGQGRVEEILSNRSNDRRNALEEAAGIMKYRVRKEESVRKLEHTSKNLERLMDLLNELEQQREPLREQAETARTYLQMRDELKHLEINVFLHQYERLRDRIQNTQAAISQLTEEGQQQQEKERALALDCAAQDEQLRKIEQAANALQNQILVELSAMESHTGEAGVLRERRGNLQKEYERLQQMREEQQQKQAELTAQTQALASTDGKAVLKLLEEDILKAEQRLEAKQQEIDKQEALIEKQKNSIIEQLNRLSDAKSQLSRMEAMQTALENRLHAILEDKTSILEARDGLQAEQAAAQKDWQQATQEHERLQSARAEANKHLLDSQKASQEAAAQQRAGEQNMQAMRARVGVLQEMARAHEGYYESVRNILRDSDRDIELKRCILGVVAEILQVPEQYETALEMSLGAAMQNIVTPTPEHAKRVIEHLRSHKYGRATMLPVSAMRPRLLNAQERECLRMPGCIGVAAELVGYDKQFQSVVENLLGRTVLVENLESGIAINKKAGAAFRIATLQGDIIHPGGSMTGGSVQKREFSLLGREREIKQLQQSLLEAAVAMEKLAAAQKKAEQMQDECRSQLQEAEALVHAHDIENAKQKEKLDLIARDIDINAQQIARSELEEAQIRDNMNDIHLEYEEIERLQSGIEEGSAATQEDVQNSQAHLAALRSEHDQQSISLTERKVQRMAAQKEEDALHTEKARLEKELEHTEKLLSQCGTQSQSILEQSESLEKEIAALGENISGEQLLVETHKEQHQSMEEERQQRANALAQARELRDMLIIEMRELEERRHRQELLNSRAELEFTAMQERIMEDYELSYEAALPLRAEQFGVTAAHAQIDELRAFIRELGHINVNAVEDYQILNERFESLQTQCDDLTKAEADLQKLIDELTGTMEEQFADRFKLIQKNFSAVFEQLFGGGFAELRLSDPRDVLNCEIDIIAQPPGKKLQLLSLLSGGERALTAIALLFAILKLKPTAFCILDEIESSLDEVNVTRFANYLRAYAEDTQFILITHRKGSMEVCNTLYGVAMEERGISKIVSARLQGDAAAS